MLKHVGPVGGDKSTEKNILSMRTEHVSPSGVEKLSQWTKS